MNTEQSEVQQNALGITPVLNNSVPIGSVMPFAGIYSTDMGNWLKSQGWLYCDGTEYEQDSANEYFNLYSVIGGGFGYENRDAKNYFRVPDCRGYFIRGVDHGTNVDPDAAQRAALYQNGNVGDKVGSYQTDAFANHSHSNEYAFYPDVNTWKGGGKAEGGYVGKDGWKDTAQTGGHETRPKNVYMNFIIKFAIDTK